MKIIITESQLNLLTKFLIENEEQIPEDVMRSIEARADEEIANLQKTKFEKEELHKKFEKAHKDGVIDDSQYDILSKNVRYELDKLPNPEDYRSKIINQFIIGYKQQMAIEREQEQRNEKVKTAKISREQIIDVFVTALEGGSNYWYYILDVPKEITYMTKQEGLAFSEACGKYVLQGGELTIYDKEELDDVHVDYEEGDLNIYSNKPDPLGYVNMDSLLDAIQIMRRNYKERYENIVMDEYDSDDADVFFQLATMGEVVFA
jgi:hypothetical protein